MSSLSETLKAVKTADEMEQKTRTASPKVYQFLNSLRRLRDWRQQQQVLEDVREVAEVESA